MSRFVAVGFVTAMLAAAPVMAADESVDAKPVAMMMADAAASEGVAAALATSPTIATPRISFTETRREGRPLALAPLYVGSAALQAWDTYSTITGLRMGAVEVNPMMKAVVQNPVVFIAVKSAITAASIYQAERLWKDHRRVAAVALMVATNSLMAVVAKNNHATLSRLQQR
jgi:hypothetical protein